MTRINTNVSSIIAQATLQRSNSDLQEALTRLSTGLRINSGRDDPAGLIASEGLRSDIVSVQKAITNSERANQLIATADSALGQVSQLLNDIRGLVTEAANAGALSNEQIAANQLQVDSSLDAIDRIAQITTFQGRRLLDGSLDFIVNSGSNFDQTDNLQIERANLGTVGSLAVDVAISTAATVAQVDIANIPAATVAVNAFADSGLTNSDAQAAGTITDGGGAGNFDTVGAGLTITAVNGGVAQDASGNNIDVVINDVAGATAVNYAAGTLTIDANLGGGAITDTLIATAIQAFGGAGVNFTASGTGTTLASADAKTFTNVTSGGRDAGSATIRVTANTAGAASNGVTVTIAESATITNNTAQATINGLGNIDVDVRGTVSYSDIAAAIDGSTGFSAGIIASTGDQNYVDTLDTPPAFSTLGLGADASGGLTQDVVFELSGLSGAEIFSFDTGSSIAQIETAIDAISEATGVFATTNGTTLELRSAEYGADAFVDIKVVSDAAGGTISAAVGQGSRANGTDVVATVNGIRATGDGNSLSTNSATLDLSLSVTAGFTGTSSFTIAGGGALFQLGPDVVSNQQARVGIHSVFSGTLGGDSGRLYELGSGGVKSLSADTTGAANVVDEVITKVAELRGRLGAFQRTTLDANIVSLHDTLSALTEAESSIRDADFAAESAALTRAQILVQSGISVLSIANSNPQNILALLR